jgi:hypothetical protein
MTMMTQSIDPSLTVEPYDSGLEETPKKGFEAIYLEPEKIKFRHDGENLTVMLSDGTFYPRVTLRRCFPFSTNGLYITVRTPDTEKDRGEEIGIINGIEKLDGESFKALNEKLKLQYFVPVIKKVNKVKEEYGFINWQVITDRGYKEFTMRDNVISTTRQISANRWLLIDINQARYEINDDGNLDEHSRALLVKHLLL